MSRTTHHFDWKRLEEKPDNWETLRYLIGLCNRVEDVYTDKIEFQDAAWSLLYMKTFQKKMITKYGDEIGGLVEIVSEKKNDKKDDKKKGGGKKGNSLKERIHMETELKIIEKDIDMIRFDTKTLKPTCVVFKCQPTFAFMIAEWCILLWKRVCVSRMNVAGGVLLDAMISLDRVVYEDIEENSGRIDPTILSFFHRLNGVVGKRFMKREEAIQMLLTSYPELMISPFSQKRAGTISFYPEQVKVINHVIDAVMVNTPMLLGDRMPPGTGKTFLAVPLAQKLMALRCQKTLLFACENTLVRTDVATLALLGKNMHLWMGRYDSLSDEVLIRPHKSCFPTTWKKVYKTKDESKLGNVYTQCLYYKNATQRFPDILVADLETCLLLLKTPELNDQFIAYIDEFVSDANGKMAEIAEYLPRQTVLLSAILPRFEDIPSVVGHFCRRHPDTQVIRIESNQLTISCTIVDEDGCVALPHHYIENREQIPQLIQRIREDPLIGRMYSPQQVYQMISQTIEDELDDLSFAVWFPTLSKINHIHIREYVLTLLERVSEEQFQKLRAYRPRIMTTPEIEKMATRDSHFYPGKTLIITTSDDRFPYLEKIKSELHADAPNIVDESEKMKKRRKEVQKILDQTRDASAKPQEKIDPVEQRLLISRLEDEYQSLSRVLWPEEFVVNTRSHAKRFHHPIPRSVAITPILAEEYEDAFPEFIYTLLLSGIGVYDFSQCTEHQRRLVMKAMRQLSFLFAGREIVFGTNIEGLTHLFIDDAFGKNVSRNVLFQLIGRAGRIGQSYEALVVLNDNDVLKKIMRCDGIVDEDAKFFQDIFVRRV